MYDLYYIKHWSLWLEVKIIVKTIVIIFTKKGV
jgi:sugar transferase